MLCAPGVVQDNGLVQHPNESLEVDKQQQANAAVRKSTKPVSKAHQAKTNKKIDTQCAPEQPTTFEVD